MKESARRHSRERLPSVRPELVEGRDGVSPSEAVRGSTEPALSTPKGSPRTGRQSSHSKALPAHPNSVGIRLVVDRLPDYVDYSDDGCSLFPSCLKCPLTRCRYDEQPGGRRAATRLRDRDLMRERRLGGKSAADLAWSFGVSKRTVQRIIRRASSE